MKTLFLLAWGSVCAFSQPFTLGVKVGMPANDFLDAVQTSGINYHSLTNRYLVGPTGEIRLPFGLAVEVDALYRHYNFQTAATFNAPGGTLTANGSTGAWEFPLLAKYRFPTNIVRPFLDAGVAWDTLQGFKQAITVVSPVPISPPSNLNQPAHNTTTGFVIGGGLDIHVPFVHVSPEVRYTHWGNPHFDASNVLSRIGTTLSGFSSNQDQVEVMVGITF